MNVSDVDTDELSRTVKINIKDKMTECVSCLLENTCLYVGMCIIIENLKKKSFLIM